jgi:hypothetical protein
VSVRIEELVVTGFPLAHPERLAPAVESALATRLAAPAQPVVDVHELHAAGVDELASAVAASVDGEIRARLQGTP